jgi:hypothetical protein
MYDSVCAYFKSKYNKWKQLNEMVSLTYKSRIMITFVSLYMICQYQYESLLHLLNNNVKKIDKHRYEITYIINNKTYKTIVKVPKGPSYITNITSNGINVTEHVLPYYGCLPDTEFTPNILGYDELTFEYFDGKKESYVDNMVIT